MIDQPADRLHVRNPTDLKSVSDGDGLVCEVPDPVQRAPDDLAELADLAVVRATELWRQDQVRQVARIVVGGRWRCKPDHETAAALLAANPDTDRLERGYERCPIVIAREVNREPERRGATDLLVAQVTDYIRRLCREGQTFLVHHETVKLPGAGLESRNRERRDVPRERCSCCQVAGDLDSSKSRQVDSARVWRDDTGIAQINLEFLEAGSKVLDKVAQPLPPDSSEMSTRRRVG